MPGGVGVPSRPSRPDPLEVRLDRRSGWPLYWPVQSWSPCCLVAIGSPLIRGRFVSCQPRFEGGHGSESFDFGKPANRPLGLRLRSVIEPITVGEHVD